MSYDYSENILVQESAGHLLADELGWQVELAYNQEILASVYKGIHIKTTKNGLPTY